MSFRPSIRLNLSFLSLSSWVSKKYFTLQCLAEIFCYYHTHLLMKTFCLHCTSKNFLLSTNSTSAVQCKILLKNPCRQNFYQNVNLKHFLEPHGPWSSTFFNPSFYIPELSILYKKNLYGLLDGGIRHSVSNLIEPRYLETYGMLCACNYIVQAFSHEVSFGKNIEHYSKFFELETCVIKGVGLNIFFTTYVIGSSKADKY